MSINLGIYSADGQHDIEEVLNLSSAQTIYNPLKGSTAWPIFLPSLLIHELI